MGLSVADLLPQSEGYLKWCLLYGILGSGIHGITSYTMPIKSMVPFQGPQAPPPNQLMAHIYGVKNFYTCMIRLYAMYNLHTGNRATYYLAMWSLVGPLFLFGTEVFVYRTVRLREAIFPFVYGPIALIWMWREMDYYLPN